MPEPTIVVEFFDIGYTRALAWHHRPQAAKLVAALADPDRGFDAIVVGEFERAFYGDQFLRMAPVFEAFGVPVWLPELDGPVDYHNEVHLSLLRLLGVHAKREVQRARFRVKAAMRAQVVKQGRHLGGRPPYGYLIGDAGPHPNKAHARYGRQLHQLEPDPVTAPWVTWIFAQRLAGQSIAAITRALNEQGVPCPSHHDPDRNPHRSGMAWALPTVASILANPRYTGRQVWNRQHTSRGSLDDAADLLGRSEARRWNSVQEWAVSETIAHQALVTEEDFVAAQHIRAAPASVSGAAAREFLLSGVLACDPCGRALDAHWVHGRTAYRCRHGRSSAKQCWERPIKTVYARQDQAIIFLSRHVGIPENHIASFLASNDVAICCGHNTWRLDVNGLTLTEDRPPHMAPLQKHRSSRRTAKTPP